MRRLSVYIEINGENIYVGEIAGKDFNDACFSYSDDYLKNPEHRNSLKIILNELIPISLSNIILIINCIPTKHTFFNCFTFFFK